jgi:hypothetical protein
MDRHRGGEEVKKMPSDVNQSTRRYTKVAMPSTEQKLEKSIF